jgi:hypothetical protein
MGQIYCSQLLLCNNPNFQLHPLANAINIIFICITLVSNKLERFCHTLV